MNLSNKAQGLPINTIILIAIGLLILVLFITFVLGGFKGFGVTNSNSQSLATLTQECSTACTTDQGSGGAYPTQWCSQTGTLANGTTLSCDKILTGGAGSTSATCQIGSVVYGRNTGNTPC